MKYEKQTMILVPEEWFQGLLKIVEKIEQQEWNYGDELNSKWHMAAESLIGYAMSAKTIIKFNEKVTE